MGSGATPFLCPPSHRPETLLGALNYSCELSRSSVARGGEARETGLRHTLIRRLAGELAATEMHGQYPSWHRRSGLEGYSLLLKALSYKPVTRRGAGIPPEAEGRRE
jgi:hypothetical protein